MRISLTRLALSVLLIAPLATQAAAAVPVEHPFPLARCEPPSPVPPAAAPIRLSNVRSAAQVRQFETSNVAISVAATAGGALQVDARKGDLIFRKQVEADGRYTFEIEAAGDIVSVAVADQSVELKRGGRVVVLDPGMPADRLAEARRLLADSHAVDLLRRAGMELETAEDDSAAAVPLLLADSVVGLLTGDAGAPRRTARLLTRRARPQVRQAQYVRPVPCYVQWESTVLWAFMDYEECVFLWNWYFGWCSLRWTMQVESAWFSLLTCLGFGQ